MPVRTNFIKPSASGDHFWMIQLVENDDDEAVAGSIGIIVFTPCRKTVFSSGTVKCWLVTNFVTCVDQK
jgi:hypothetical protein